MPDEAEEDKKKLHKKDRPEVEKKCGKWTHNRARNAGVPSNEHVGDHKKKTKKENQQRPRGKGRPKVWETGRNGASGGNRGERRGRSLGPKRKAEAGKSREEQQGGLGFKKKKKTGELFYLAIQ